MTSTVQVDTPETTGGSVKVKTMIAGEIDVPESNVVDFVSPMIGFPDTTRFVIFQTDAGPLFWLQSVEDQQTCFCLLAPFTAGIDVDMAIGPDDANAIGAVMPSRFDVYTVVVFGQQRSETRTNLRAPMLVNAATARPCRSSSMILSCRSSTRCQAVSLPAAPAEPAWPAG